MKPKPIFTVKVPFNAGSEIHKIRKSLQKDIPEYHILVFNHYKDDIEFNAFYEKDFNEVKFEELKQIVQNSIK